MKIIIHGGFFSESDADEPTKTAKQAALKQIVAEGFAFLQTHSATESAVYTVSLLENNLLFNAGTGSQFQSDGAIRMSAALMDGTTLKMSGVINIENIRNPILIAERLQLYEDRILGGDGAFSFAQKEGFESFNPEIPQRRKEFVSRTNSSKTSTVGCICLDGQGRLAAATSTGGKGFEMPGRISDSATVAGTYANKYCGVSLTGVGEDIVSGAMAAKIVTRVTDGMNLKEAFHKTFQELKQIDGYAGAIALDRKGNFYHQESFPAIVYASYDGVSLDCFN